ncbi:S8 family serine peptidase [Kitasatospora viridis]|uniref:Type VII secretion-associated serine protease mycosin n=1 Tax=Kitasatospora viridis TaxID=281105 RepID=A0A561UFX9_9ACTN|nr:S8 family serine peptidase [Kitasatospora viridis]TWF98256.1 type VII secretion-associated serine protease mycosin [Kitasatospora viridis]
MRRTGAWMRGLSTAALLSVSLSLAGVFAPAAQAYDNPRQGEWYLDVLHMSDVWQVANGSGVTVAVIDTGVKADHPDLVGQLLPGKDFSGLPGGADTDPDGHGTGMASIIAGSGKGFNGNGVIGLAPGARILPIKIDAERDPSKVLPAPVFMKQIDQAITYAADQGAKVINISQAVRSVDVAPSDVADLQNAVNYAIGHGSVIVAGAGNSGQQGNPVMYPADSAGVAAIAAHDQNGASTAESENGSYIALAAPGVNTVEACLAASGYCQGTGTSDSSAMISAAAAILFSEHPSWTGNQVLRVLISTANKAKSGANHTDYLGFGNISIRTAVRYTGDPGPADVNPLVQAGISVMPPASAFLPGTASSTAPSAGASVQPSAPASGAPAPSSSAAPAPAKSASSSSGSSSLPFIVGIVVAAVLVVGGAAFFLARRKRTAASFEAGPGAGGQEPPYGYPMPPQQGQYGTPAPPPYQAPPPPGGNPYREG